eukprot:3507944-Pyramimonas_sp.AAC.1
MRPVLNRSNACGHRSWGLRWGSLWGYEALYCVGVTHADTATVAFGGVPYGATKLRWMGETHANAAWGLPLSS